MQARIETCTGSRGAVQEIVVTVPASFGFRAGQYLEIELDGDLSIPLSIASAPQRLPELHLHYRSTPQVAEAQLLDRQLARGDDLSIRGPFGSVWLATPLTRPLLIVAGGTGGAQAMGLLDALLAEPPTHPVTLLWCADRAEDLYRRSWLEALDRNWLTSEFIVDARRDAGNRSLSWLQQHAPELTRHYIILSGGPGFVRAAADALESAGIDPQSIVSDVFAFSPKRASRGTPGADQPPATA